MPCPCNQNGTCNTHTPNSQPKNRFGTRNFKIGVSVVAVLAVAATIYILNIFLKVERQSKLMSQPIVVPVKNVP